MQGSNEFATGESLMLAQMEMPQRSQLECDPRLMQCLHVSTATGSPHGWHFFGVWRLSHRNDPMYLYQRMSVITRLISLCKGVATMLNADPGMPKMKSIGEGQADRLKKPNCCIAMPCGILCHAARVASGEAQQDHQQELRSKRLEYSHNTGEWPRTMRRKKKVNPNSKWLIFAIRVLNIASLRSDLPFMNLLLINRIT